jgi:hypothetical protein
VAATDMGTLEGFASPFGPPPATSSPLASPFGDFGTCTFPTTPARCARALALGLAKPLPRWCAAGEAGGLPTRLRVIGDQRDLRDLGARA